ncbi:unnamed protein product [Ixodes pacificus]
MPNTREKRLVVNTCLMHGSNFEHNTTRGENKQKNTTGLHWIDIFSLNRMQLSFFFSQKWAKFSSGTQFEHALDKRAESAFGVAFCAASASCPRSGDCQWCLLGFREGSILTNARGVLQTLYKSEKKKKKVFRGNR